MNSKVLALAALGTLALASPAGAQEELEPTVRVHLEGEPRAVLQMHDAAGWADVCNAPCDLRVPLDASYRVNGEGIQQSKKFVLPSTYGVARVEIAAAPAGLHVLGLVGVSLGAVSLLAGLQTMLIAVFTESCSDCIGGFANTTEPNVAWALMGAGLLSILGGGVLAAETHTQVDLTTNDVGPAARAVLPERRAMIAPPGVAVPLVSFSF